MILKQRIQLGLLATLALLVASCGIQKYKRPEAKLEGLYRDVPSSDTSSIGTLPWSQIFGDAYLQKLIEEGIAQNLDLKIAAARIQQAEAYYLQNRAALFPALNGTASATFNKLSDAQGGQFINNNRIYQAGLSSNWEADIWGKLRSSRKAGYANLLQSEAGARAVQTGLVANIANYYYTLLALDQQLLITQQTVQNWVKTVETMRQLKDAARVTGAAVVQSEASRYAAEVTIPDLKQRIRETENALSVLLGRSAGAIARNNLDQQTLQTNLPVGVPAQLLSNRPDVQQAEFNYRYYFENVNVARAFFYPTLTITASGGLSNVDLQNFFSSGSVFGSFVGGLTQPIFNKRANKTRLEVAKAQEQEALFGFQRSLLTAGQEVSDALALYQNAADKTISRQKQIEALQKSIEYTEALLRYGSANYVEVINAQQSYLSAQLNRVNDRLQQYQSVVRLYRALGGGWK
ncbi:efflux transporter outer membrane subunit [Desertivirga arenae]|uniref:efflux transporter outer membrane subunit n=1 Tax=Desertivirga arenae TaxID=2810309 RepID=UPI001A9724DF|nr:efflux transporter outer membrane subunit [Pedobacter sp. SYSU D00823]